MKFVKEFSSDARIKDFMWCFDMYSKISKLERLTEATTFDEESLRNIS